MTPDLTAFLSCYLFCVAAVAIYCVYASIYVMRQVSELRERMEREKRERERNAKKALLNGDNFVRVVQRGREYYVQR